MVWETLLNDSTYRQWTSAFSEGSHAQTDWKKGSKILFLDGSGNGMISRVADAVPSRYMSIEHVGMLDNGVEDYDSPKTKEWAGAMENYTLDEKDGGTEMIVDTDVTEEYREYMLKTWPQALGKLKDLSESVVV